MKNKTGLPIGIQKIHKVEKAAWIVTAWRIGVRSRMKRRRGVEVKRVPVRGLS